MRGARAVGLLLIDRRSREPAEHPPDHDPDDPRSGPHASDPLLRAESRLARIAARVLGHRGRRRQGRWRSADHDALVTILLPLLHHDLLGHRSLTRHGEDELVLPRIDPQGPPIKLVGERLTIDGDRHGADVAPRAVLRVEDDRRLRALQLVEPLRAVVLDQVGTRRVGAPAELLPGLRQLFLATEMLRLAVGIDALVLRVFGKRGGRVGNASAIRASSGDARPFAVTSPPVRYKEPSRLSRLD